MIGKSLGCSFCGRCDSDVDKLVTGPKRMFRRVYICANGLERRANERRDHRVLDGLAVSR